MNPLRRYPLHKEILTKLFNGFETNEKLEILDAGSGRTSLYFLTKTFPNSQVTAIIYPGDERKKKGIKKDVVAQNFVLKETDIRKFEQTKPFDIVLAHLLLGEATKFGGNSFKQILKTLFEIKTKYLVVIDIENVPDIDYRLLLSKINKETVVGKKVTVDKYIGFTLIKN